MKNCNIIRDLLPLYEDKETGPETTVAVKSHLERCPECREYYSHIHRIAHAMQKDTSRGRYRYSELAKRIRRKALVTNALICASILAVLYLCKQLYSSEK